MNSQSCKRGHVGSGFLLEHTVAKSYVLFVLCRKALGGSEWDAAGPHWVQPDSGYPSELLSPSRTACGQVAVRGSMRRGR